MMSFVSNWRNSSTSRTLGAPAHNYEKMVEWHNGQSQLYNDDDVRKTNSGCQ